MKFSFRSSLLALCAAIGLQVNAQQAPTPPAAPVAPNAPAAAMPMPALDIVLNPEAVELFSSLPVQEQGRVKPLDTLARFRLLRFSGKQSGISATRVDEETGKVLPVNDPATSKPLLKADGKPFKFTAMEWLLVSWFRPDIAKELNVFVVDNSDAVVELSLPAKQKRDRYSFNDIKPARPALMDKMSELRQIESKNRTPVQRALAKLAMDYLEYEMILGAFDFARPEFIEFAASLPADIAPTVKDGIPDWAAFLPKAAEHLKANPQLFQNPASSPWLATVVQIMLSSQMSGDTESFPRFFPPPAEQKEVWHNIGTIMSDALKTSAISADDIAHFKRFTDLYKAVNSGNAANYVAEVKATHDEVERLAEARNESGHVALELGYHRFDYFYKALLCFIFSSILLGLSWASPGSGFSKGCVRLCVALCIVGAALSTYGIIVRCLIMERPPITNLYETIIFISAAGVIGALVAEWMTKKGWALTVATVAGTGGMFLSIRFMTMEGRDTMEQLQAVLITNFWLATHVPCVNLGYAVCMVAAIFSAIYVVLKLAGKVKGGDSSARELTRLAYSFVMAGLLLSLVGTVLGGIWANYSWGRFWGWDPKENGALLIVLMCLVILHARLGGYIKEAGFHNANLFLGMIVLFSWFATNQLGIGLHSYGAMEGAWMWLYIFWGTFTALIVVGVVLSFLDRTQRSGKKDRASKKELNLGDAAEGSA